MHVAIDTMIYSLRAILILALIPTSVAIISVPVARLPLLLLAVLLLALAWLFRDSYLILRGADEVRRKMVAPMRLLGLAVEEKGRGLHLPGGPLTVALRSIGGLTLASFSLPRKATGKQLYLRTTLVKYQRSIVTII